MELHFLGRGAAFNPLEGNTSAYYREGDRLLLIDCGESVFTEFIRRGLFEGVGQLWIAVSHFHSDHCGSLGSVVLYCAEILHIPVHILLPKGDERYETEMRQLLQLFGVSDECFQFDAEGTLQAFTGFSSMSFCRTKHAPGMVCYSFSFDTPEGGLFYTADTATADGIRAFIAAHPCFERIYTEGIDAPKHPVHLPLHELADAVPEQLRGKVRLMHLNGANCEQAAKVLGFSAVQTENA